MTRGFSAKPSTSGPWSTEVILITDPEHAVPVQIERTGLRTIAVGAGNEGTLALPYLPANADVKPGDLLITSGLGGVFPAGYPGSARRGGTPRCHSAARAGARRAAGTHRSRSGGGARVVPG